jgi:hypothetical protein
MLVGWYPDSSLIKATVGSREIVGLTCFFDQFGSYGGMERQAYKWFGTDCDAMPHIWRNRDSSFLSGSPRAIELMLLPGIIAVDLEQGTTAQCE